ncbi:MAG: hypothetical protein HKN33_04190 [Pyrinomonadaceae bacterium]|nr:hypothetical protein [Pyrinomonadaceae bacterium]
MNKLTKAIATTTLALTIFAFPVFGDCGEMNSGNKCLVQNPTDTTVTKSEKKDTFDFDRLMWKMILKVLF